MFFIAPVLIKHKTLNDHSFAHHRLIRATGAQLMISGPRFDALITWNVIEELRSATFVQPSTSCLQQSFLSAKPFTDPQELFFVEVIGICALHWFLELTKFSS